MNFSLLLISVLGTCFGGFDVKAKDNVVVYWGQNSYGHSHLNQPDLWEKPLRHYCNDDSISTLIVSFLYNLRAGTGKLPILNLSNHCGTFFGGKHSDVLKCPSVEEDIKYCQKKGKTILLSIGGEIGSTTIPSPKAAIRLANDIWNMFMGGKHTIRPFGSAIIDGIDLDIESNNQKNYPRFLKKLQGYFRGGKKKYFVTAAPQCEYPDRNLHTILDTSHFDALFIQFYNNWCGVHNYDNKNAWNWNSWEAWANKKSTNKNVTILLGVAAAKSAASFGYIPPSELNTIISDIRTTPHFGGVMVWDASQNMHNTFNGKEFGKVVFNHLKSNFHKDRNAHSNEDSRRSNKHGGHRGIREEETYEGDDTKKVDHPHTRHVKESFEEGDDFDFHQAKREKRSKKNPKEEPATNTYSEDEKPNYEDDMDLDDSSGIPKCPVDGEPCTSLYACAGSQFATCNHGTWILRDCPAGLLCAPTEDSISCDWPNSPKVVKCSR